MRYQKLDWPLMNNNITKEDREALIEFLKDDDAILTQSKNVVEFEKEWSKWLGVKYSVFVNSGASANLLTMTALKWSKEKFVGSDVHGSGIEIIVPALTWVSDIASVIQCGFKPVFVDIDPYTLGMDFEQVEKAVTKNTAGIFLTHVMGLNALSTELVDLCRDQNIVLIEDCCEAHGARFQFNPVGVYGGVSNFSFYYAHHMSTIEGGMICTDDEQTYERIRALRSHGMYREMKNKSFFEKPTKTHEFFTFLYPAYNVRSTELNAVIGLSQLKRLDENNDKRRFNFRTFLHNLDDSLYDVRFDTEESVNYALILNLNKKVATIKLRDRVERLLTLCGVEFRRGLSGGGNQLRQPYLSHIQWDPEDFKEAEHISDFSWYIGNYPDLSERKIRKLCELLNQFAK